MRMLKEFIGKKIFGYKYNSETYEKYLRSCGVSIGKGFRIFDSRNLIIDTQNPHMLEIGDNVRLTSGVKILTHDYSWSVIAGKYHEILGGGWDMLK